MRRVIAILISLFALHSPALAAAEALHFSQTSFDFGRIAEEGGVVRHTFRFRNTSSEPIVILGATTSCGCTRAEYSHKPVAAGAEGEIVVSLAPLHYPGAFDRKIMVHTSQGDYRLRIYGRVTPRPLQFEERFPIVLGEGIRISDTSRAFGYIEHGKRYSDTLWLANRSSRDVHIEITPTMASGALQVKAPQSVAAGDSVAIHIGYALPERCNIYGTMKELLEIRLNGKRAERRLIINGIAIDSRDEFADTEEPKIELSENFIKFGRLKYGKYAAPTRIKINNTGVSPLEIRHIELEEAFFGVRFEGSRRLRSGRSAEIIITPHTKEYGALVGRVKIITNDPQHPIRSVKVTAIIEE